MLSVRSLYGTPCCQSYQKVRVAASTARQKGPTSHLYGPAGRSPICGSFFEEGGKAGFTEGWIVSGVNIGSQFSEGEDQTA
jgi:hypothetical protein